MSNLTQMAELYRQTQLVLTEFCAVDHQQVSSWLSDDGKRLTVTFPFACSSEYERILQAFNAQGVDTQAINLCCEIAAKHSKVKRLKRVKNIIAVASGKGGVGKSTTAVNLAYALLAEGVRVGIVDADIYGPSIPIMLGNQQAHPSSDDQKHMQPLQSRGLVSNSIGYLVPPEDAAVWRGPMASRALQQIMNETLWPELDYLIVDMPPGTGDIQLTMAQQLPLTAAVIVTTPQDLALADGRKGIAMFQKVDIPVLGVVENMSYYQCPSCGHKDYVFAKDGGQQLASHYNVPLLGCLPLDVQIGQHADGGTPIIVEQPDSPVSQTYGQIARALSKQLALTLSNSADLTIDIMEKH